MSARSKLSLLLANAVAWLVLLVAAGLTLIVAGVLQVAGPGWASIAAGAAVLAVAAIIRQGLARA